MKRIIKLQYPHLLATVMASVLVLLWTYSLSTKLQDLRSFKLQMADQVFSESIALFLVYCIIIGQILATLFLLFSRTRFAGFSLSLFLMVLFTGYIALVLLHAFTKSPCHCISFIPGMTFTNHLYFNLFFAAVATIGFILTLKKERRNKGMDTNVSHAPLPA